MFNVGEIGWPPDLVTTDYNCVKVMFFDVRVIFIYFPFDVFVDEFVRVLLDNRGLTVNFLFIEYRIGIS